MVQGWICGFSSHKTTLATDCFSRLVFNFLLSLFISLEYFGKYSHVERWVMIPLTETNYTLTHTQPVACREWKTCTDTKFERILIQWAVTWFIHQISKWKFQSTSTQCLTHFASTTSPSHCSASFWKPLYHSSTHTHFSRLLINFYHSFFIHSEVCVRACMCMCVCVLGAHKLQLCIQFQNIQLMSMYAIRSQHLYFNVQVMLMLLFSLSIYVFQFR